MEKKQVTIYEPGITREHLTKRLEEAIGKNPKDFNFDIPTLYGTFTVESAPFGKDLNRICITAEGLEENKEEYVSYVEKDLHEKCWKLASFIIGMIADMALDEATSGYMTALYEAYVQDLQMNPADYGFTDPESLVKEDEINKAYAEIEEFVDHFSFYDFLRMVVEKEVEYDNVVFPE